MRVVAGGTGFLGRHLVNHWLQAGHEITVIGRDAGKIMQVFGQDVHAMTWDILEYRGEALFKQSDVVVNLAGAPIGGKRWNRPYKVELIKSRTHGINIITHLCEHLGFQAPLLMQASAVSVYGLQHLNNNTLPEPFDEEVKIRYNRVHDFSSHMCHAIERGLIPAINANCRVVKMRLGVIISSDSLVIRQMKRILSLGLGGPIGNGYQPFSWITLHDVLAAIDFLIAHPDIGGPVNFVAPKCVNQRQFITAMGKRYKRPAHMPTPGFLLKLLFGQMAAELMLEGTYAIPKRLQEAGFRFEYPTITKALQAMR